MTTGPEAGYYADPSIPGYIRYWDGTQWVPGTSRPAPEQLAPEPEVQDQAPVPEQPLIAEVQVAAPINTAPNNTAPINTAPDNTAPDSFEQTQSVATMVVPSAFGARGGYGGSAYGGSGWNGGPGVSGYDPSPYAQVPGLNGGPESELEADQDTESEVRVVELASAGSRVLARIIDVFIAAVVSAPATATLLLIAHRHDHAYVDRLRLQAKTTYRTLGMDTTGIALWAAALAVLLLTVVCFDAFRLSRSGQTVGRRLLGVQVVTADTASTLSGGAAFFRSLLFWVLTLLPVIDVFALGGVLWGRPYRQGWHEKLTRTISIRA